jgi:hypothetical protein
VRVQTITRLLATLTVALWTTSIAFMQSGPQEAPAAFDGRSNGFLSEVRPAPGLLSPFEEAAEEFTGPETIEDGLGPVFNAAGCGECHATPILGGSSQLVERRAGRWDGVRFLDHPGGSLIQDRATDARPGVVLSGNNVIALRSSLSVLGDGFVEAIDSNDIIANASRQPVSMRGTVIEVPVLEAPGQRRVGRFGWKNQHASLLSFSADAYLNEMGITSPMQLNENTNNGRAL